MTFHNVALYSDAAQRVRHQVMDMVEAAKPFYPRLAMTVASNADYEKYDWLASFPGMREWLGDRKFHQLSSSEFMIENRDWESGIQLPKKDIDDGRTGYFDNMAQGLAVEASYHPDELMVEVMEEAGAIRCFDGAFFFDTNHVYGDSGIQSNLLSFACADPAEPTPEECRAIVELALTAFRAFKRDNGKPYMRPTLKQVNDLLCVYPHQMDNSFKKAYVPQTVVKDSESGNGAGGVQNYNVVVPDMLPLTERTGNYIDVYRTGMDGRLSPFVFQDRSPLGWDTSGADQREFKDMKVFGDARYNVGVLAWYKAIRINLTQA